jgi:hypothetical protein
MAHRRLLSVALALIIVLAAAGVALAAFAYNSLTGPTISGQTGTQWTVSFSLNVTTLSAPDKFLCLSTTPQGGTTTLTPCVPPNQTGIGIWTCSATVTNQVPVSWSLATYTAAQPANLCGGTPVSAGPSGSISPLAVNLARFSATRTGSAVRVVWETVSETDNAGFKLYRSADANSERALLASVPATAPGATDGGSYEFVDRTAIDPNAVYWLEDLDLCGVATLHGPIAPALGQPNAVTARSLEAQPVMPAFPLYVLTFFALAGALWFVVYRLGRRNA